MAQVRSVTGNPQFYPKSRSGGFPLRRMDQIELGSAIETGPNERVVIKLSDESIITVLQNSRVVLKEIPAAASVRDLLEIELGRVQVKIHHVGGKPNPYQLNSPSASIAVRGTEFIVDVLQNGETTVYVQEGQVEVWPRNNPENKRLVNPGGSVIVRPGGDISLSIPGPGVQSTDLTPTFFSAFADPHFDSLENPAYASEFKSAEGRLSMVPSISPRNYQDELLHLIPSSPKGSQTFQASLSDAPNSVPTNYTLAPQMTFFTPIPGTRLTVGGGISALRTRMGDLEDYIDAQGEYQYLNNSLKLDAINASLLASYKLGANGKTSLGIGIDRLSGYGNFLYDYDYSGMGINDRQTINSEAKLERTSITLGMLHKFSESATLGIYYRTGFNSSDQQNKTTPESAPFGTNPEFAGDRLMISTISSEAGIRFRAPITRRLFYGLEGSYLYEQMKSRQQLNQIVDNRRFLGRRARLGGGLGFAPTSRIIIDADVTGGLFNTSKPAELYYIQYDFLPEGRFNETILPNPSMGERGWLFSTHIAAQGRIWRNAFASSSFIKTINSDIRYYYDKDLGKQYSQNYRVPSDFITSGGFGWKFKQGLTAEYLLSWDNRRIASHSLILRYTFNFHKEE